MSKIEIEYQEFKTKIELITKEKNQKEARELIGEIDNDKSILLIYLIPERIIQSFNVQFNIIRWKDSDKAKDLINQGFSIARSNYDRQKLAEIIFAIYREMENPYEFKTGTLK